MASFMNKLANTITNSASPIIGRDNMTKLTNSLNKNLKSKSKYRDYMKHGNTIQLISKSSHLSLQICSSPNDANRLILLGNGQIGSEYLNAHFVIEVDAKSKNIKFRNHNNFICYDNEIPCILTESLNPRNKQEAIRARNEFRLHEIIGSDEYFALESVYFPGRYLSILPDGSITSTKDKTDEKTHFFLHVIHVYQTNMQQQQQQQQSAQVYTNTLPVVSASSSASSSSSFQPRASINSANNNFNSTKEQESVQPQIAEPVNFDAPPTYTNLYPTLPK